MYSYTAIYSTGLGKLQVQVLILPPISGGGICAPWATADQLLGLFFQPVQVKPFPWWPLIPWVLFFAVEWVMGRSGVGVFPQDSY